MFTNHKIPQKSLVVYYQHNVIKLLRIIPVNKTSPSHKE